MLKPRTIQFKLFASYSTLIICIIAAFIISFYIYTAGALESKSFESLYQLSAYISNQLDIELKNMNSLSDKILFSQPILKIYYSDIYAFSATSLYEQRKFNELIYSITGPQFPVFQINMFQMNGNYAGIGFNNNFLNLTNSDISGVPWVKDVLNLNGTKLITIPHKDDFGFSDKQVISLCRSFSQSFGKNPDSVLEIQQDYNKFEKIIHDALNTPDVKETITQNVYVFNSTGELVYPPGDMNSETAQLYWNEIHKDNNQSRTLTINDSTAGEKYIFSFIPSGFSGWTVAVSELENTILNPVTKFRNSTLFVSFAILIITSVLSFFVSKGLTTPIKKLHKSIKNLSLQSLPIIVPLHVNSGVIEFDDLNQSFVEMCKKLEYSLEDVVASRSHEIQARMLALQSQMNPHFLYNTIAVISIMAEGDKNLQVVQACSNLSNMLRYISSDDAAPVILQDELKHTLNFLDLMKIRYRDNLNFEINIPEDMLEIKIPKLIIQPLVENCTKYAVNVDPPWIIQVYGKCSASSWEISVHDNGEGFDENFIKSTVNMFHSIDLYNLPGTKLDGMGLINIFIRLKLMYGENAVFKLSNHPAGGAIVTLGGSYV